MADRARNKGGARHTDRDDELALSDSVGDSANSLWQLGLLRYASARNMSTTCSQHTPVDIRFGIRHAVRRLDSIVGCAELCRSMVRLKSKG